FRADRPQRPTLKSSSRLRTSSESGASCCTPSQQGAAHAFTKTIHTPRRFGRGVCGSLRFCPVHTDMAHAAGGGDGISGDFRRRGVRLVPVATGQQPVHACPSRRGGIVHERRGDQQPRCRIVGRNGVVLVRVGDERLCV